MYHALIIRIGTKNILKKHHFKNKVQNLPSSLKSNFGNGKGLKSPSSSSSPSSSENIAPDKLPVSSPPDCSFRKATIGDEFMDVNLRFPPLENDKLCKFFRLNLDTVDVTLLLLLFVNE
uniref:Uncharacterized protein n=1 Tax=Romanomermis culicivorax TaxID=13658 RepID=A0A915L341_ROMCU